VAAGVRYCGNCGAANPPSATHCGECGSALAPVVYVSPPPAPPAPPRANLLVWGLAGGALLTFALTLGLLAVLLNTANPGGRSTCPPDCPPPPHSPALSAPHTYTSKSLGWSIDYYDPEDMQAGTFGVTHQDDSSITWTWEYKGSWPIVFQGEKVAGRSPRQLADQLQQATFADAEPVYTIPGSELGYTGGYGEVYDLVLSQSGGQSQRARLVIMVAVRGEVAVELVALGAYVPNTRANFGHPNPASTWIVVFSGPLANNVRWPGEAPL
jgi:hypothetical protein